MLACTGAVLHPQLGLLLDEQLLRGFRDNAEHLRVGRVRVEDAQLQLCSAQPRNDLQLVFWLSVYL